MLFLASSLNKNHYRLVLILMGSLSFVFSSVADVPENVQDVFARNTCLDCHAGANPSGKLSLDDVAISETSLVSIVADCSNVGDILVEPGDVDASVLHQKLAGVNFACGGVMPPNGVLISSIDLATIDNWIISIGPAQQFGLLTLQETSVEVNENQADVVLTVNRELGNQGVVTVDFIASRIAGDSAENGTDFTVTSGTLTFADGEIIQQITVPLIDDDVFEGTEVFTVQLIAGSASGGAIIGEPSQTKVNIIDNELDVNPGSFLFSRVTYNVDENIESGMIEITVLRVFGEAGEVTVNYATSAPNFAAVSGSDYQATAGTLVFPEGDKSESFTITILDDSIEESNEFFIISLTQPTAGAEIIAPASVLVTIIDNDDNSDGGGDDGGDEGDNGDNESGGDAGSGNSGNSGGVDIVSTEDAEFETAGSFSYPLLFLISLLTVIRRLQKISS